ncbi:hypothetical protein [Peptostreptococcus stomatis]|uniref:hypothetical protein n=1 Tax=Peptostreptococcus stomatis TaxID=341694 RepID=UPI003F9F4D35
MTKELEQKIYESKYSKEYGRIGPELDKLINQRNSGTLNDTRVNLVMLKDNIIILLAKTITNSESELDKLSKAFSIEE